MSDSKLNDYARKVAEETDWSKETPVLTHFGWRLYITDKIDFRIYVIMQEQKILVLGCTTWAALCADGMPTAVEFANRHCQPLSGVYTLRWEYEGLVRGMRKLGWVPKDGLGQLIDAANQLLVQAVGVNEGGSQSWRPVFAREYARLRERRDEIAEQVRRLDAMLSMAEETLMEDMAS